MLVTKQNLIDIGIKDENIVVYSIPIIEINNKIMTAKCYNYDSIEEMCKEEFIQNAILGSSKIFMCYNESTKNVGSVDKFILRLYK